MFIIFKILFKFSSVKFTMLPFLKTRNENSGRTLHMLGLHNKFRPVEKFDIKLLRDLKKTHAIFTSD